MTVRVPREALEGSGRCPRLGSRWSPGADPEGDEGTSGSRQHRSTQPPRRKARHQRMAADDGADATAPVTEARETERDPTRDRLAAYSADRHDDDDAPTLACHPERRVLADRGIELEVMPANSNSAQNAASVARGDADLGEAGSTGAVVARAEGMDVVGIAYALAGPDPGALAQHRRGRAPTRRTASRRSRRWRTGFRRYTRLTLAMPAPGSSTRTSSSARSSPTLGFDPNSDVVIQPVSDATDDPSCGPIRPG